MLSDSVYCTEIPRLALPCIVLFHYSALDPPQKIFYWEITEFLLEKRQADVGCSLKLATSSIRTILKNADKIKA